MAVYARDINAAILQVARHQTTFFMHQSQTFWLSPYAGHTTTKHQSPHITCTVAPYKLSQACCRVPNICVAGSLSRSLLQSPDCTSIDRCGSSCKPCDSVANGEPSCISTPDGYSCGVRCNKGFVEKVAEGYLYCGRSTGLRYNNNFIKTPKNATKRTYQRWGDISRRLQNLGATTPGKVAEQACGSAGVPVPFSCLDALLMAVLPATYSSNNSADTGGYTFISPAQVSCHTCVKVHGAHTTILMHFPVLCHHVVHVHVHTAHMPSTPS